MGALAETCDSLNIPYRMFGFDSAISEVVNYAKRIDEWMKAGGRAEIAAHLGISVTVAHDIIADGIAHCRRRVRPDK